MQTKRGVARRDCRCAQARTRFTPRQRFAKEKLCLSIKAFYAVRIFARLRGGVRIAQQPVDFRSSPRTRRPSLDSRVRGNERATRGMGRAKRNLSYALAPRTLLRGITGISRGEVEDQIRERPRKIRPGSDP